MKADPGAEYRGKKGKQHGENRDPHIIRQQSLIKNLSLHNGSGHLWKTDCDHGNEKAKNKVGQIPDPWDPAGRQNMGQWLPGLIIFSFHSKLLSGTDGPDSCPFSTMI